ncbi:MAG: hypothetical protein ACK5LP_10640, partial [Campylobacteraceae bacterium]
SAVNLPDEKKGEKVVLLFSSNTLSIEDVQSAIKSSDISPLMTPSEIYKVEVLPKLASGKADFKAVKELALTLSK